MMRPTIDNVLPVAEVPFAPALEKLAPVYPASVDRSPIPLAVSQSTGLRRKSRFDWLVAIGLTLVCLTPVGILRAADGPVVDRPVADGPVVDRPVADRPVADSQADRQPVADPSVTDPSVTVGITGHYRIGRWTAVKFDQPKASNASFETLDGDGVRVVYAASKPNLSNPSGFAYVVPGSEAAPLVIRAGDETLLSTRLPEFGSPSRGASAIPNDMPWIVCLGDPLGVDQLGANEELRRDPQIAVSIPDHANELPDSSLGYHGVDVVMINGSGLPLLKQLKPIQRRALTEWIQTGGRVFLTLGESAKGFSTSAPWLIDLLPIDPQLELIELSPSAIETYTTTQIPLDNYVGVRLPKGVGEILLMGRTTRRVSVPIAADYNVALGRVTVLAADLESELFASWPQRKDLIQRVTGGALSIEKEKHNANRITAFDDLAGQTRSTLDQFPIKRKFSFSVLALMLLGLIALIGPLEYWLINRVLRKPLLGWLTFPLVTLGLSAVLASWAAPKPPAAANTATLLGHEVDDALANSQVAAEPFAPVQCNRLEVVDIDAAEMIGRGFAWSFLYSHPANQFDVNIHSASTMKSVAQRLTGNFSAPFGTPGITFGGIQIAGEDARLPPYHVAIDPHAAQAASQIKNLAIAPRSSKSIATFLNFSPSLNNVSKVRRRRGSELLEGELANPLSVDLLDASLIYGNWVYLLPTRFRGNSVIESVEDLRQKNFRWRLSRQEVLEKNDIKNESWSATDFNSHSRIAEMLMFHDAVGGSRYTGLKHAPLKQLDLSSLLVEDRCILMGRLRDPWLEVQLKDVHQGSESDAMINPQGKTLSMVRIILPVQTTRSR